jgi:hypothetical protein
MVGGVVLAELADGERDDASMMKASALGRAVEKGINELMEFFAFAPVKTGLRASIPRARESASRVAVSAQSGCDPTL